MSKIKKDISNYYQDFFDKNLSERDPDLYNSVTLEVLSTEVPIAYPLFSIIKITGNFKYIAILTAS